MTRIHAILILTTVLATTISVATPSLADGDKLEKTVASLMASCEIDDVEPQRYDYHLEATNDRSAQHYAIVQIFCERAAYNSADIWVLGDTYGDIRILSFASPRIDVDYGADGDETRQGTVSITGYFGETMISNSDFDTQTGRFSSFHKWRGLGDAASGGTWRLDNGRPVLVDYFVDSSWDGEVNPQTIVEFPAPAE